MIPLTREIQNTTQRKGTYLQSRNRFTDMKAMMATKGKRDEGKIRSLGLADTNYFV